MDTTAILIDDVALELERLEQPRIDDWRFNLPVLAAGDVVLREVRMSDAPALQSLLTTPEITRYISQPPSTVEGFERFIAASQRLRASGEGACFAITLTSVETLPKQVDPGFDLQPFEMPARVWHVRGKHAAALAPGDVVLAVDGEDISAMSPLAVIWLILSHEPGSQILVRFQRGDTVSTVAITLRRQTDQ